MPREEDPQAKKCQRLAANRQKLGAGKEGLPQRIERKRVPAGTLMSDGSLQDCEATRFCCFKEPPDLWYFVTSAPRNSCVWQLPKLPWSLQSR